MKYHNGYPVLRSPLLRKHKYARKTVFITQLYGENALGWYKQWGLDGHDAWDIQTKGVTQFIYHNILGFITGDRISKAEEGGTIDIQAGIVGTVISAQQKDGGKEVRILSDIVNVKGRECKLELLYLHLDSWRVQEGQKIVDGVIIGKAGNTGKWTTGAHLHFAVRPHWKRSNGTYTPDYDNGYNGYVDPTPYMADGTVYQKGTIGTRRFFQFGKEITREEIK